MIGFCARADCGLVFEIVGEVDHVRGKVNGLVGFDGFDELKEDDEPGG